MFPGVKINFSRSGISTTYGIPGASINIGPKGSYLNIGIPGTGIHSRTKINPDDNALQIPQLPNNVSPEQQIFYVPKEIGEIKSDDNNSITSKGILGLKETLLAAYKERQSLQIEINQGEDALKYAERRLNFITLIPFHRFLFKKVLDDRQKEYNECKTSLLEAKGQFLECKVSLKIELDNNLTHVYDSLKDSFIALSTAQYAWDITSSVATDRYKTRSAADHSINRQITSLKLSSLDFIESEYPSLYFRNINGSDLYFFPAFLVAFKSKTDFALIEYKDVTIDFVMVNFVEEETVPADSITVDKTWKYCNKNGSRDMRFSNNYEIPIVQYGKIMLKSAAGLNEAYMFSKVEYAKNFANSYLQFIMSIK